MPVSIVGLSGSLRRGSYNSALLHAAAEVVPADVTLETLPIRDVPLYDADMESADGLPASVVRLKAAVAGADALLLATPEYNGGIPGVFKNAVDWMSRPPPDIGRVFGGLPVAVIEASPGGFGTILAQDAWHSVLRTLGTRPWWGGRLQVSHARDAFDADGRLADEDVRDRLRSFMVDFARFAADYPRPSPSQES